MEININGAAAFAATGGKPFDPDLPNIVFVHGAGLDHTVWTLFNRYYARHGFNSIAVDLPGRSRSQGKPLPAIEDMARWLLDFTAALGIKETALAGHSMGGLVALEAASRAGETVKQLILLGVAAPMPVSDPLLNAAREKDHSAVDMIMLYAHSHASQIGGNPVAGVNILNSNMRLLERSLNNALHADLKACHEYANGLEAARKCAMPTRLVLGAEDRMTPLAASAALIDALPTVEVEVLPDCGHLMLSEQPEAVHASLARALRPGNG